MDATTRARNFLEKVMASGLDEGTVLPADVVRHVEPMVLAHHLPVELRAKLLAASLGAPQMTADLVVTTVGTLAMCEHLPMHLLWAVLAECGPRSVEGEDLPSVKPERKPAAVTQPLKTEATKPEPAKPEPAKPEPAKPEPRPMPTVAAPVPAATMTGKAMTTMPLGSSKRAETAPPLKAENTKTDIKQIDDPQPKPNVKAKAEPPKPEPVKAKDGKPPLSDKERTRTSPIVPKSEFEVDTNVGDEWGNDDIVDIVEEADVVSDEESPTDWKPDEETVNRFKKR